MDPVRQMKSEHLSSELDWGRSEACTQCCQELSEGIIKAGFLFPGWGFCSLSTMPPLNGPADFFSATAGIFCPWHKCKACRLLEMMMIWFLVEMLTNS